MVPQMMLDVTPEVMPQTMLLRKPTEYHMKTILSALLLSASMLSAPAFAAGYSGSPVAACRDGSASEAALRAGGFCAQTASHDSLVKCGSSTKVDPITFVVTYRCD